MKLFRPWLILLCTTTGCGFWDFLTGTTDGGGDAASGGFGTPTLEVTVSGVHFGPTAPDTGSGAILSTVRDSATGRVTQSVFRANASITSLGASCVINAQRFGDGIAPIAQGSYTFTDTATEATGDGLVVPIEGESATIPQGSITCTGTVCAGATLVLSTLDSTHVEGYLNGTLESTSSGYPISVVCAFYLPWLSYTP